MYKDIPIYKLSVSYHNVRKENNDDNDEDIKNLAKDIKHNGLLNPIIVQKESENKYNIVAGRRRYLAFLRLYNKYKKAPYSSIPCKILISKTSLNEAKLKSISLSENINRKKMTVQEQITAYMELYKNSNKDFKKLKKSIAVSESKLRQYINIGQNLNPELIPELDKKSNKMTVTFAIELIKRIPDKSEQLTFYNTCRKLSNKKKIEKLEAKQKQSTEHKKKKSIDKININGKVYIQVPKEYIKTVTQIILSQPKTNV
ncbi:MAG: ParB/RepB/Spo0J family partition protein [archaeon]